MHQEKQISCIRYSTPAKAHNILWQCDYIYKVALFLEARNGAKIICRASNQTGAKRLATAMTGAAGHEAEPCSNKNNNDFVLL